MASQNIRQPASINSTIVIYDKSLKVRFVLLGAGTIFSFMLILCCPALIFAQTNRVAQASSTATSDQLTDATPTKTTISTRTPRPVKSTTTPRSIRTSTPDSKVNAIAKISCADNLYRVNLRRTPGYVNKSDAADSIYEIPCGEYVELLGDTEYVDGLTWWKVEWNGHTGWVADHTASGKTILIFDP